MRRFVSWILLMSLFINAAHAVFIDMAEKCSYETTVEYVSEMDHGSDCGDLCDIHHFLHFHAIPPLSILTLPTIERATPVAYHMPFRPLYQPEPSYRPPIR